jgi:hypothetical protein
MRLAVGKRQRAEEKVPEKTWEEVRGRSRGFRKIRLYSISTTDCRLTLPLFLLLSLFERRSYWQKHRSYFQY